MRNTLLIRRYAKAFFDFAVINKMEERGLADLELISNTIKGNRELRNILSQPFINLTKKETIIKRVFQDEISNKTLNFIDLMLENNHPEILSEIIDNYRELYYEYKHIAVVTITTAMDIDEHTQQELLRFVRHKVKGDIKIVKKIDKNIIGGFVINYLDYRYDASIYTKLRNLESLFTDNLYVKGY